MSVFAGILRVLGFVGLIPSLVGTVVRAIAHIVAFVFLDVDVAVPDVVAVVVVIVVVVLLLVVVVVALVFVEIAVDDVFLVEHAVF